jgi:hypothetical protein
MNTERHTQKAPNWDASPLRWAIWYIEENGQIYRRFRVIVNNALAVNPQMVVSADNALHVIRWQTNVAATGDTFAVNDHASALFARLYVEEYPYRRKSFRLRRSIFDRLSESEHERLLLAFEPLRINRPYRGAYQAEQ